jgi:hypothetical protein
LEHAEIGGMAQGPNHASRDMDLLKVIADSDLLSAD